MARAQRRLGAGRVTTSCESFAPLQYEMADELTYAVEEGAAPGTAKRRECQAYQSDSVSQSLAHQLAHC